MLFCLFLHSVTSMASFLSVDKYYYNVTPFPFKASIVIMIFVSLLATLASFTKHLKPSLLNVLVMYIIHFLVLLLAIAGPRQADDEKIVVDIYSGKR